MSYQVPVASRREEDALGAVEVPVEALHGIHTARALENFPLALRPVNPVLIHAYGWVKLACARTNRALGFPSISPACGGVGREEKADAIERACLEMAEGRLDVHLLVDALQGGAGTSTNMNVNEVLANRALQLLGRQPGEYAVVHPLDDLNLHQSTNDTYPTALRVAAIRRLRDLEQALVALQESFQTLEQRMAHVVKVGRTEYQDATLITLGREMSAYAEAFNRDRWRVYKCEERLRVLNLGGTAVGTGLAAPRQYIFQVTEELRALTGIGLARAENLVDATQNVDVFPEVSGMLKACAVNLLKCAGDLRLLSSGPDAGLGEIRLPARQAGSSIMPGKVNPVIPEAVSQAAMMVMANDQAIAQAASMGSLELNAFLPLIADRLLDSLDLLVRACGIFKRHCVDGIEADEARCRAHIDAATATATALLPAIGYEAASAVAAEARHTGEGIRAVALRQGHLSGEEFDALTAPESVCRLGSPDIRRDGAPREEKKS